MSNIRSVLAFLLCVGTQHPGFAQLDSAFLHFLVKERMKTEHFQYIVESSVTSEQRAFELARYHLLYEEDSLFFNQLPAAEKPILADTGLVTYISLYYLTKAEKDRSKWFEVVQKKESIKTPVTQVYGFFQNENYAVDSLPEELREHVVNYQKCAGKRPFLASSMSAVFPGLGQFYIGKPRSFGTTFLSLAILGLQTAESYSKLGLRHILTWLNAGFFGGFYIANVVGSSTDLKVRKKEFIEEYYIHAAAYYQYHLRPTLY